MYVMTVLGFGRDSRVLGFDRDSRVLGFDRDSRVLSFDRDSRVLGSDRDSRVLVFDRDYRYRKRISRIPTIPGFEKVENMGAKIWIHKIHFVLQPTEP